MSKKQPPVINPVDAIQVGGEHYKTDNPAAQHWNIMISAKANYFQGVVTKYIDRYKKKNGLQDLEKARHYAVKYSENIYSPTYSPLGAEALLKPMLMRHGLASLASRAMEAVMRNDMKTTIAIIDKLIAQYTTEPGKTYVNP